MISRQNINFDTFQPWGLFILRLTFAMQLIIGTQDNIFSWERMLEFEEFLKLKGVPMPLISAHISVYTQFICGLLWILGLFTRPAALIMVINFTFAILIAHASLVYSETFPAINLLAVSLCLMLTGAGKFSIDFVRK